MKEKNSMRDTEKVFHYLDQFLNEKGGEIEKN